MGPKERTRDLSLFRIDTYPLSGRSVCMSPASFTSLPFVHLCTESTAPEPTKNLLQRQALKCPRSQNAAREGDT